MARPDRSRGIFAAISLLSILSLILWLFCIRHKNTPAMTVEDIEQKRYLTIKKWRMCGYVEPPSPQDPITRKARHNGRSSDFDDRCDKNETSHQNPAAILKSRDIEVFSRNIRIHKDHLDLKDYKGDADTILLSCVIRSERAREVILMLGCDGEVSIWLNDEPLAVLSGHQTFRRYSVFVRADMQPGDNLLMVKTRDSKKEWRILFDIGSYRHGVERYKEYSPSNFLHRSVVKDSLQLDLDVFTPYAPMAIDISAMDLSTMHRSYVDNIGNITIPLPVKRDGLYRCTVSTSSDTLSQMFYVGDIDSAYSHFEQRARRVKMEEEWTTIDLNAILIRFDHLLNAKIRSDDDKSWMKKVVHLSREAENFITAIEHGINPYASIPGTHFQGFRSSIDSSIQHYMIHIPDLSRRRGGPLALIVVIPYNTVDSLPFLKNLYVADIFMIERMATFADKNGCAILWPGLRGNSNSTPIEYTDLFETLNALKTKYDIDDDRLYLSGICKGGTRALFTAMRFPSRFAAIGAVAPAAPLSRRWDKNKADFLQNLGNTPVYLVHSRDDERIPLTGTLDLMKRAKAAGVKPHLQILQGYSHYCYPDRCYWRIFESLLKHRRAHHPQQVVLHTNELKYNRSFWLRIDRSNHPTAAKIEAKIHNDTISVLTHNVAQYSLFLRDHPGLFGCRAKVIENGRVRFIGVTQENPLVFSLDGHTGGAEFKNHDIEGPIRHAFCAPFLIVPGTEGNEAAKTRIDAVCTELCSAWAKRFFSPCRIRPDKRIQPEDIATCHLILVGDSSANSLMRDVLPKIPLMIKTDGIQVDGVTYRGEKLVLHMIYPNPLNTARYIVLLTSNDPASLRLCERRLFEEGTFDYGVWFCPDPDRFVRIATGFFDQRWTKKLPGMQGKRGCIPTGEL